MSAFSDHGISHIHHYTPLHYLPFIARSESLMGKPSLVKSGFAPSHLRSMSSKQDRARGFGDYAFLTLDSKARILRAKLDAGFPHIGVKVPSSAVDKVEYMLCRYNVAMTRYLRRKGSPGFPASATNGYYYKKHQIPVAKELADQQSMLTHHLPRKTMIEVLIDGDLALPADTQIVCFSKEDAKIADCVIADLKRAWAVTLEKPPGPYNRNAAYAKSVKDFVEQSLADAAWKGNGLEFDRV